MPWKPDYVTTTELRDFLRIGDTEDDDELAFAISAASRAIDTHTNRQFGLVAAAEDRYYTAYRDRKSGRWIVEFDDLMTITGLTVAADLNDDGTYSYPIDDFALRPVNAQAKGRPWTYLVVHPTSTNLPNGMEAGVEVHAQFGWTAVPNAVKEATLLQASRFHHRRFSPFGVAGSPETGSELRLLSKVDPDVAVSLRDYNRWWAAA